MSNTRDSLPDLHPRSVSGPSFGSISQLLPKRKRLPRTSVACENCRYQKLKCDGKEQCYQCNRQNIQCTYSRSYLRPRKTPRTGSSTHFTSDITSNDEIQDDNGRDVQEKSTWGKIPTPAPTSRKNFSTSLDSATKTPNSPCTSQWCTDESYRHGSASAPNQSNDHYERNDEQSSDLDNTQSKEVEQESTGFLEVNKHTNGAEFYGAAGLFPFLNRLRSKARTYYQLIQQRQSQETDQQNTRLAGEIRTPRESPLGHPSIINYLQNVDQQARGLASGQSDQSGVGSSRLQNHVQRDHQDRLCSRPSSTDRIEAAFSMHSEKDQSGTTKFDDILTSEVDESTKQKSESVLLDIENHFIETYFQNLHLIHPILERESFLLRCGIDIRQPASSMFPRPSLHQPRQRNEFSPVYYAVLALGSIVASEDTLRERYAERVSSDLRSRLILPCGLDASSLSWAKFFFEKAKASLPDIFQVCSLDSTQALFLLSVFCQNALQPHSCYIYSGMAVRTALAIGLPHKRAYMTEKHLEAASRTWWSIYTHEVEMCCSSGRDSLLRPPSHYSIRFPYSTDDNSVYITFTVSLAGILNNIIGDLYGESSSNATITEKVKRAKILDATLEKWKNSLSPVYQLDQVSLKERDMIRKQKVVLKLRYYNARILLYRPFLENKSAESLSETSTSPIYACLEASCQTISLLYNTYLHCSYFRTWWYNTTYALNATMVILYVIFLGISKAAGDQELIADVKKSLDIFNTMDVVIVARQCARLIQEVLDIAEAMVEKRQQERNETARSFMALTTGTEASSATALAIDPWTTQLEPLSTGISDLPEDPFSWILDYSVLNSIDFSFLDNF